MAAKAQQITQLYFFHLKQNKFYFKQMGVGYTALNNIPGLVFVRLLGTGAGAGFSLFPDFSTYAVLLVESQADADDFRNNSSFLVCTMKSATKYVYLHCQIRIAMVNGRVKILEIETQGS